MGPLQNVLGMMPGMPKEIRTPQIDDRELDADRGDHPVDDARNERRKPDLINGSRRGRIAKGAGVNPSDVNSLLKQFKQMQQMMRGCPAWAGKGKKGKKGKRPRLPMRRASPGSPGPLTAPMTVH